MTSDRLARRVPLAASMTPRWPPPQPRFELRQLLAHGVQAVKRRDWPRPLRGPDRSVAKGYPPPLPELAVVALNRMGFGPRPGDVDAFRALGGNDDERLGAYVELQLDPAGIDDSECDARIAASGYTTLDKSLAELFADHHVADPPTWEERILPALETELATWTRAIWSRRQLLEVLVQFWHDHFNVYAYDYIEGPVWVHYDRDVIRANALGRFRTMLEAMAKAPAMLMYLDNFINFAATSGGGDPVGSNENFARELLELHTLGADASFGNLPADQVPGFPNPVGYCQEDVVAAARAFTGWTFGIDWIWGNPNDGLFLYREDLHDTLPKQVLGLEIPSGPGSAQADGRAVLNRIARHPATGQHVAGKLCRRLVGDQPPQSLIDSAAALFTAQWQAPDQIAQVVRHIVLSAEFRSTWGEKIKRPFEIAVSALRASSADLRFTLEPGPDRDTTDAIHWLFGASGQDLFACHPPIGYPDVRERWQSANPRVACWRLVNWLVEADDGAGSYRLDLLGQTPPGARSANQLVDFWSQRVLERALPDGDRLEFVRYMAQGHNPDMPLPLDSDESTQSRLRGLVGLLFMSPEFLWR